MGPASCFSKCDQKQKKLSNMPKIRIFFVCVELFYEVKKNLQFIMTFFFQEKVFKTAQCFLGASLCSKVTQPRPSWLFWIIFWFVYWGACVPSDALKIILLDLVKISFFIFISKGPFEKGNVALLDLTWGTDLGIWQHVPGCQFWIEGCFVNFKFLFFLRILKEVWDPFSFYLGS